MRFQSENNLLTDSTRNINSLHLQLTYPNCTLHYSYFLIIMHDARVTVTLLQLLCNSALYCAIAHYILRQSRDTDSHVVDAE